MTPAFNDTAPLRGYSPITLDLDWPKMTRLLVIVFSSVVGSILNGFFVASFFVEKALTKVGNVFHACTGLSDLIITTIVMPTCAVVLLSGQWDTEPVCNALHFFANLSSYSYTIFFMLVALESYHRVCRSPRSKLFTKIKIGILSVSVYGICCVMAGVGVYLNLDYNYCTRRHYGNFNFKIGTAAVFQVLPFIVTSLTLYLAARHVRVRARKQVQYKRSQVFDSDRSMTALNIVAYLFFVFAWVPYLIIVHIYPTSADSSFYYSVWFGLGRSIFCTFIYSCFNPNFRQSFSHLFNYCCCKNSLSTYSSNRYRHPIAYRSTIGDVRVHIMHHAINVHSSPRYSGTVRATHEL